MKINCNPSKEEWSGILARTRRSDSEIEATVKAIIERVGRDGDKALKELAKEIDKVDIDDLKVSDEEIAEAEASMDENLKQAIRDAAANIRKFHQAQLPKPVEVETTPGVFCKQKAVPIRRIGLYIPGGNAPLFSTVLMLGIPANVAGCKDVILCTPPSKTGKIAPAILYAAKICGIGGIYKAGGAQAIAAMAYGTESISARDKIFGPGNRYVMKAKQIVSVNKVAIDMPAGPSEVMVMADETCRPEFVAADLLSQAEHGTDSQAIAVCSSIDIAKAVDKAVSEQIESLPRKDAIMKSLEESSINVIGSRKEMVDFANSYAPEHLIIAMKDPWAIAEEIYAAGSVFLGNWSCESAGDYASGTNHTLPTSGWARAYSGVNIDSYMRKMTYQELSKDGLANLAGTITAMADAEGLQAHGNAVRIRTK